MNLIIFFVGIIYYVGGVFVKILPFFMPRFAAFSCLNCILIVTTPVFADNIYQAFLSPFKIIINGEERNFTNDILIVNNRTYIPLREVAENLGMHVDWNGDDNVVGVNKDDQTIFPYKDEKSNLFGLKNAMGKVIVEPKYTSISDYDDGIAYAEIDEHTGPSNKKRIIALDTTGKELTGSKYHYESIFSEGVACVWDNGKAGYIDKIGNLVIPLQYIDGFEFSEGLARVVIPYTGDSQLHGSDDAGLVGYINHNGDFVISAQYHNARDFHCGLAAVQTLKYIGTNNYREEWSYIRNDGTKLNNKTYDYCGDFSEGIATVATQLNNKYIYKYINSNGEYISQLEFEEAENFKSGYAKVKQNGKWGLINNRFEYVEQCKYDNIDEIPIH